MQGEMLDDQAGLRHELAEPVIAQQREFSERPELQESGALVWIAEIDEMRRERRLVLVERDQHLLAEAREWVEIERQGHGFALLLLGRSGLKGLRSTR